MIWLVSFTTSLPFLKLQYHYIKINQFKYPHAKFLSGISLSHISDIAISSSLADSYPFNYCYRNRLLTSNEATRTHNGQEQGEREQPNISSYGEYILPLGRWGYHPLSASCSPPALPRWANAFPSLGTQAGILYVRPQADIQQVECQFLSFLTKPTTAGTIIERPTAELQNLLQKKVVFSRADKCDYWSERSAHIKKGITSNFLLFRNLLFSSATLTSKRKEREWKNKMLSRKRKNTEEMDWALEASVLTCNMEKRN